jgi:hypothetical protein
MSDNSYHWQYYLSQRIATNVEALAMWRHSLLVQPGTEDD